VPHSHRADPGMKEYQKKYCMEGSFLSTLFAREAKMQHGMEEHRLQYILTTGANWAGPIRDFRLVVDKGSADNLVSFCADGVRKIGPTQFEVRVHDFVPTSNLSILILSPGNVR
jgi:Domain of unknown function (DUF4424)